MGTTPPLPRVVKKAMALVMEASPRAQQLLKKLNDFMDKEIYPNEDKLEEQHKNCPPGEWLR